jgi:hypothetical protein
VTDIYEAYLDLFLDERFVDWRAPTQSGLSLWLHACLWADHLTTPSVLQKLLSEGCEVVERFQYTRNKRHDWRHWDGWSCLFFLVNGAINPGRSNEFEALRLLLRSAANPYMRDSRGQTLLDVISVQPQNCYSRYRRDLWSCALQRCGYHIVYDRMWRSESAPYNELYTPRHYRALSFGVMEHTKRPGTIPARHRGTA